MTSYVVYEGSEDWSALYVNGKLALVSDHYLIDEKIRQIFNVETIQSDSFMRGGDYASDVAPTIDDIRSYETIHKAQVRDARISEEVDRLLSEGIITGSRENWINVFRKNDVVP
jgi:hypothetical protein